MKIPNKVKWITAVSILAVSIPTGIALANPAEHQLTSKSAVVSPAKQTVATTPSQPSGTTAQTKQVTVNNTANNGYHTGHTGMNDGYHNNTGHYSYNTNTASNQSTGTKISTKTYTQGNHQGHTGMNDGYHNSNMNREHSQHGMGGHE